MRSSGKTLRSPRTNKRRVRVYAKLALNSILQKGMVSRVYFLGSSQLVLNIFSARIMRVYHSSFLVLQLSKKKGRHCRTNF